MPLFCLTGGGTFGHVSPNIVLADELVKNDKNKILYVGSKGGVEKAFVEGIKYIKYCDITSGKLRRYWTLRNLLIPFQISIGFIESVIILYKHKPHVVFSSGGYVGMPLLIAAYFLRIPIVTYDADMTMGLANRVASFFSSHILCNFKNLYETLHERTKGNSHWRYRRVLYVGPFIRKEFKNIQVTGLKEKLGLTEPKPILLIFGGSQGAQFINEQVIKAREKLMWRFQIVHVFGRGKLGTEKSVPGYIAIEFISDNFASYMALADVIVSRAGASSIFEMLYLAKPHVLIPLSSKHSRGDQEQNARYFKEQGVSIVVTQEECTADVLYKSVCQAIDGDIAKAISKMSIPNAAETTASILEEITKSVKRRVD